MKRIGPRYLVGLKISVENSNKTITEANKFCERPNAQANRVATTPTTNLKSTFGLNINPNLLKTLVIRISPKY